MFWIRVAARPWLNSTTGKRPSRAGASLMLAVRTCGQQSRKRFCRRAHWMHEVLCEKLVPCAPSGRGSRAS